MSLIFLIKYCSYIQKKHFIIFIVTEHADGAEWAPQVPPAVAAAKALLPGTWEIFQQYS